MDEHYQHDNGGDGAVHVQEFASDAPGLDAKEPRQNRDRGSVATFEAKAEEIGKYVEAKARVQDEEPRQDRDQGSVGTFVAKAEEIGKNTGALGRKVRSITDGDGLTAVSYVDAWQRQVARFYGMRLRKNYEFAGQVAKTGSVVDLVGLQCAYVRDMLADYASSVREMTVFGFGGARLTAERLDRSE